MEGNRIMRESVKWFALLLMLCAFWGCASNKGELISEPTAAVRSDVKIRVADVSNDTGKLFDVDVIGLLWNGLEDGLKKRGMLAAGPSGDAPLQIKAHVLKYKKGNAIGRTLLPVGFSTVLYVRAELIQGATVLASAETKRDISFGEGAFARGMWKKVFEEVGEDLVKQLTRKI